MAEITMRPPESEGPRIKMSEMRVQGGRVPEIPGVDRPFPGRTVPKDLGPKKKGWWEGLSTRTRLAIAGGVAGAAVILGGGTAAYKNIEPIRQGIDNIVPGLGDGETPLTFDNSPGTTTIGGNIIKTLSQEEIDRLFPTPFTKLNDGKNTVGVLWPFEVDTSLDPNTRITLSKSFSGSDMTEREQYQDKGMSDVLSFQNVPGGTTIVSPVDGFLVLSLYQKDKIPPNGSDCQGGLLNFTSPEGKQYRLIIGGSTDYAESKTGFVFKSLTEAPVFKAGDNQKTIGSYGVFVKKGRPIFELIKPTDNKPIEEITVAVAIAREGELGQPINMGKPAVPTNLDLFVTPDGKLATKIATSIKPAK